MSEIFWEPGDPGTDFSDSFEALLTQTELGFFQLPKRDENWRISHEAGESLQQNKKLFVIGQGGSALGGKLLVEALGHPEKEVFFLNDFEPDVFESALESIADPSEVAWLVVSKSGGTLEVLAMLARVLQHYREKKWNLLEKVQVITEPKDSALRSWAEENSVPTLDHPMDVGGRFSALTPVGLVPAVFAGLNLAALQDGALRAVESPKAWLEFLSGSFSSISGDYKITVFWAYSHRLKAFPAWVQQLWAESLGKTGQTQVSTPLPSYGSADQHSVLQQYMEGVPDKNFVILREKALTHRGVKLKESPFSGHKYLKGKCIGEMLYAQSRGTEVALREAGHPVQVIETHELSEDSLGELIMAFELMVGTLGQHLNFNAFDQPGVEAGKKITRDLLAP